MQWIFSIQYLAKETRDFYRRAVVGPANVATVEAALSLAGLSEEVRAEIRADATVRLFVEGALDPEARGYFMRSRAWSICIGSVHEVIR